MSVFQTAFLCFRNTCRKPPTASSEGHYTWLPRPSAIWRTLPCALAVLQKADIICAEDTRVTAQLLSAYGIQGKLVSVREHNERQMADKIVGYLSDGMVVAQVSDAGTSAVCDPVAKLARRVREVGFKVVPVVGASAVMAALSVAGVADPIFISTVLYRRNRESAGNCLPNGCGRRFPS